MATMEPTRTKRFHHGHAFQPPLVRRVNRRRRQFLAVADAFIVNVAIPSIRADLHASGAEIQAIIAVYQIAYAALVITGGRLGATSSAASASSSRASSASRWPRSGVAWHSAPRC